MAGMLKILEKINLDEKKIKDEISKIFNIVHHIMEVVFAPADEGQSGQKGLLTGIIEFFLPEIAPILQAIFALVYLLVAFLCIAVILGIAGMLKILELIKLDEDKIIENVNTIFRILHHIMDVIFAPSDEGSSSQKGLLTEIIGFFLPPLKAILEALMSIVYLLLAFVCIAIILGIAGELKLIEMLKLDEKQIMDNISLVFAVIHAIQTVLFAPQDEGQESSKSVLQSIIGFFLGDEIGQIVNALFAIVYLALAFVSIAIVVGIAKELEKIQNIKIDTELIKDKANRIFKAVEYLRDYIFKKADDMLPPPKEKGIFGTLISFFIPDSIEQVVDALTTIGQLAIVFLAISAVKNIGEAIDSINRLELDIQSAKEKTGQIMDAAAEICRRIFSEKADVKLPAPTKDQETVIGGFLSFMGLGRSDEDKAIQAALKRVEQLGIIASAIGALKNITNQIQTVNDIEFG